VGLPPVVSARTVVLVLGSFPGRRRCKAQQYYAHPQNHFWRILQACGRSTPCCPAGPQHYAQRCAWLLARGLGLWDVYASCEREGSLDTSIRNAQVNDFASLLRECPGLAAIAHNGGESFKHARAARRVAWGCQVQSVRLPSTSPANASAGALNVN
jgi:hypoxanthine-DNA glycosylase